MPLLWLSLAFLVGIILGDSLDWPAQTWLFLIASLAGLWLAGRFFAGRLLSHLPHPALRFSFPSLSVRPALPVPVLILALLLGAARFRISQPQVDPGFIAWYSDREGRVVVEGIVAEPPDARDRTTHLIVRTARLHPQGELLFRPVKGLLLARIAPGGDWRYGDRVRLEGLLESPPQEEDFSYREYLARQGIHGYMPDARAFLLQRNQGSFLLGQIFGLKARLLAAVFRLYPDPEAALLAGILLGVESAIPETVQDAFRDTGTSHIIAISGFNFTIIAGLFAVVFGRLLGKRKGALAAGVGIGVYAVLVGANAAVVRAAIMGGLSLFARQLGRRQDGLNSLAFVAAAMAVFDPNIPWDVGFQLSFFATLGLILYAEPFSQAFLRAAARVLPFETAQRLAGPVGEYFLFTLAAQVTTLPVTIYHFQRISLSSVLANPIILPAQPMVMILGGLSVLLGLVWLPLGQGAAYLAWPFAAFTIRVVEWFAGFSGGTLVLGEAALPVFLGYYALLLGWTFGRARFPVLSSAVRPSFALAGIGLLAAFVWRGVFFAPDGRLHLHFLDVGSGTAVLVQSPGGRYVLVDGGPSASALSTGLGRRLPLPHRALDWLVVASASEEELAALPRIVERFPPGGVLWSGPPLGTRSARALQQALGEVHIPIHLAEAGQSLDLGEGAYLKVLAVSRRGAVLEVGWDRFKALLPLGMDFAVMESLRSDPRLGPVTVLLLGDGGYAPVNPREWIEKLNPQVAILSAAPGDWRGVPDPETLEAVRGYPLLRTDQNGWIHLSTDGTEMWLEVERR